MKQFLTAIIAAAAGGGLVWFLVGNRAGESAGSAAPSSPAQVKAPAGPVESETGPPGVKGRAPRPVSGADKAADELKDQIVVTLGKVTDVGSKAGSMLQAKMELRALRSADPATLTPEQHRRLLDLERQRAEVLGMLPEIAGFQDNPEEYAGFFGSLLQEAAGLDGPKTKEVSDYMRSRSEAMIAAGLNTAKEPADAALQEAWEEKRDAFNEESVAGISKILPPGEAERIGFTDSFMELLEQDFDKAGE